MHVDPHLDVGDVAEQAPFDRFAQGQYVRAEAKLEVDGCRELRPPTSREDSLGFDEIARQGLLDQDGSDPWEPLHDVEHRLGWHRQIEHDVLAGNGFFQGREDALDVELPRQPLAGFAAYVEHAEHGPARTPVSRKLRVFDDAARAEEHHWPGGARRAPALAEQR